MDRSTLARGTNDESLLHDDLGRALQLVETRRMDELFWEGKLRDGGGSDGQVMDAYTRACELRGEAAQTLQMCTDALKAARGARLGSGLVPSVRAEAVHNSNRFSSSPDRDLDRNGSSGRAEDTVGGIEETDLNLRQRNLGSNTVSRSPIASSLDRPLTHSQSVQPYRAVGAQRAHAAFHGVASVNGFAFTGDAHAISPWLHPLDPAGSPSRRYRDMDTGAKGTEWRTVLGRATPEGLRVRALADREVKREREKAVELAAVDFVRSLRPA